MQAGDQFISRSVMRNGDVTEHVTDFLERDLVHPVNRIIVRTVPDEIDVTEYFKVIEIWDEYVYRFWRLLLVT